MKISIFLNYTRAHEGKLKVQNRPYLPTPDTRYRAKITWGSLLEIFHIKKKEKLRSRHKL